MKETIGKAMTLAGLTFYKSGGCDQCGGEGYRGRVGVYEVLGMETNIRKLVTQSATSEAIEDEAKKNGMSTMSQDGFLKAAQGTTTIEEILRVTKE
jgi:type II secretory ATPase GspE/PulE/Tfp pilus assembly ATPase PilB-like protein